MVIAKASIMNGKSITVTKWNMQKKLIILNLTTAKSTIPDTTTRSNGQEDAPSFKENS
jgi:hypothetical protein